MEISSSGDLRPRHGARFVLQRRSPDHWDVTVTPALGAPWMGALARRTGGGPWLASPEVPAGTPWAGELDKLARLLRPEGPERLVRWRPLPQPEVPMPPPQPGSPTSQQEQSALEASIRHDP